MKSKTKTLLIAIGIVAGTVTGVHLIYSLLTYWGKERALNHGEEHSYELRPERGRIIDMANNVLAQTDTVYDVHLDPQVWVNSNRIDDEWESEIRRLVPCLAEMLPVRDSIGWLDYLEEGRKSGRRYISIAEGLTKDQLLAIQSLPVFELPPYRGGRIIEPRFVRDYPFGSLARRTIGYTKGDSLKIGLEKTYDQFLSGHPGYETIRYGRYEGQDIRKVKESILAQNGMDIHSTLSMNATSIADSVLRTAIQNHADIKAGCFVLMNVKTGAIHVMTNLTKTEEGIFELYNYAIGRTYDPGSLAQAMTYAAILSDGHLHTLQETIPTNHGRIPNLNQDAQIVDYERTHSTNSIAIQDGFALSSRYVPAYLVQRYYYQKPEKFIEHLRTYCPEMNFELDGLGVNNIPTPKSPGWNDMTLQNLSYGYNLSLTPLSVLSFYNSIANKGSMVQPFLLDRIVRDNGEVVFSNKPKIMGQVMPENVADTLSEALKYATQDGPGRVANNWNQMIVGKSGISPLPVAEGIEEGIDIYHDKEGRRKYAATFVGYFPQEAPEYGVICVLFSERTKKNFYAGSLPANLVNDFVNQLVK